jgi:Protein of unknown function (DUF3592)
VTRHEGWLVSMPVVVLILGLALAGGGIAGQRRFSRLARATRVPGTIVGSERRSAGRTMADFPVVEFQALDGTTMRATVPQGRVLTRPKVGRHVRVSYDPSRPAVAYIGSAGLRFGCYLFIIVGLGLVALAASQL